MNIDFFVVGLFCGMLVAIPIGIALHFVWLLLTASERDKASKISRRDKE